MAGDYVAVQSFNCTYVSRAFHDEDAFRKTIKPPPAPEAFSTVQTREIASYIAGFLTAWNALASLNVDHGSPYNVYPSGLFPAVNKLLTYCNTNPEKNLIDGILNLIGSEQSKK